MSNQKLEIINKFVNENFEDNESKAFDNLEKLISFILDNNITFEDEKELLDIVDIEMLINNNGLFKKMVSSVCIPENIDKLKLMNVKFVNLMIKAYTDYIINNKAEEEEKLEEDDSLNDFDLYASTDEMDSVSLYLKSLPSKLLTKEEVVELYIKRENGDEAAFNEIIKYNLKLVVPVAKKYARNLISNSGIEFLDLIQAGNEGLIKGTEKFNYKLGWKFSTYVRWWIRQSIERMIANESRNIRIPVHTHELILKIRKYGYEFHNLYNRYPNEDEIAKALEINRSAVIDCLNHMDETISLNTTFKGDDGDETELMEFIPGSQENLENQVFEKVFNYALNNLSNLSKRELEVIKYRFGFYNRIYTLEEVGKMYGLTRERIRQIESNAKRKLQRCREIRKFM